MTNRNRSLPLMREAILGALLFLAGVSTGIPLAQAQGPNVVSNVRYSTVGKPTEAIVTSSGNVFVSVNDTVDLGPNTGIEVFAPTSNGILQSSCVNSLSSSVEPGASNVWAWNLSFFPGSSDLALGANDAGVVFYHVADLLRCNPTVSAPGYVVNQGTSAGTFDVAVTHDGKFAFVANESGIAPNATLASGITLNQNISICIPCNPQIPVYGIPTTLDNLTGNIGVAQIQRDANGNFTGSKLVGNISTGGTAIPSLLLSPDGARLYVVSEVSKIDPTSTTQPAGNAPSSTGYNTVSTTCGTDGSNPNGLLTVIDVGMVEASPSQPPQAAILSTVAAGCEPVRLAETKDGKTLWVIARGDNRVLAFSTAALETNPNNALLGSADTGGTAPVGLSLFQNDRWLAVANSNRFAASCTVDATGTAIPSDGITNMSILDISSPQNANVVQTIPTGCFPRGITVGPDDETLYLTNFKSNTLQEIQVSPDPTIVSSILYLNGF